MADRRVQFDFEIEFSNGGGLRGQGFRLDIEGDDIADEALADYLVRDMRLLMVGAVRIRNKRILAEAHKRPTRAEAPRRLVDVSHDVEDGMVTYRGYPRRSSATTGLARSPAATSPPARSSTSAGSRWSRTRARTWTARFTATPAAAIWRACRSNPWPTSRASWCARRASRAAGSTWRPSPGLDVRGKAVLLHTGWDVHWRTERYFDGHPFLTAAGAEWLAGHGAALVGIDSLNIDDTADLRRSAHSTLLGRDIPIVEHLCGLERLPEAGFRFFAVPVKVRGLGTFPVRAFAVI